jgi:hypothetical protein
MEIGRKFEGVFGVKKHPGFFTPKKSLAEGQKYHA